MFLVILAASLFYLFPHVTEVSSPKADPPELLSRLELKSSQISLADHTSSDNVTTGKTMQNAATKGACLLATVHLLPEISQIYLENTGSLELHQVQIVGAGRSLGILSELICGEKKVLAVSGDPEDLQVSALDPSDAKVLARVQYIPLAASESPASPISGKEVLSTKAAHPHISHTDEKSPASSPLLLTITANKSEGRAGEVVGYRCLVKNLGQAELSDICISCAGKVACTKYLPAGKELYLDGALQIENNTRLSASARALDARGRIYNNNSSFDIWKISPFLKLEVTAPKQVHRGESVSLQIRIENKGAENLTDILVRDGSGEIDRIAVLPAGAFQVLQKEMKIIPEPDGCVLC